MRRSLSRSGPMWRSANEEALIGGTPGGREVEVDEQPPPLSYPERVLQSRHVRAVLLPERFRGGFAPSAPPGLATGDLSHADGVGRVNGTSVDVREDLSPTLSPVTYLAGDDRYDS